MKSDSNHMTSISKAHTVIGAEQAEYVRSANEALASMRDKEGRWWLYSVSHKTFELVIGEPLGKDNIVLGMTQCDHITGPVRWPNQQLEIKIIAVSEQQKPVRALLYGGREFEVQDVSVGFRVVAGTFGWQRNFDLLENRSMILRGMFTH